MKNICNIVSTLLFAGLLLAASCKKEGDQSEGTEAGIEANGNIRDTEAAGGNEGSGRGETDKWPVQDTVTSVKN